MSRRLTRSSSDPAKARHRQSGPGTAHVQAPAEGARDSTKTKAKPWTTRLICWLDETSTEMDYLSHRLIELQMDARSLRIPPNPSDAETLEAIYALPAREPDHGLE